MKQLKTALIILEYDYTGNLYSPTPGQYERRGERLDDSEPGKTGDRQKRIQLRPRKR